MSSPPPLLTGAPALEISPYPVQPLTLASLRLRMMSLVYEGILLFAVLFVASYLFLGLARDAQSGFAHVLFQIYLLSVCGAYFVFCWTRTGQTLPMKTWRMRLETVDGMRVAVPRALLRAALATAGYLLLGISVLWAFIDRDRQFLHDRLAGTRLVVTG